MSTRDPCGGVPALPMEPMEEEAEDQALTRCTELKDAVSAGNMDEGVARELGELWMDGSWLRAPRKMQECHDAVLRYAGLTSLLGSSTVVGKQKRLERARCGCLAAPQPPGRG